MPNYYNPYNFYPVTYPNINAVQPFVSNSTANPSFSSSSVYGQQMQLKAMEWVEGEVGAKAFQMPQGWPANQPIPLWDSTDTIIYLKSWGPMGIPNPIQKIRYEMPEQQNQTMLQGSGLSGDYVTKDDLKVLRDEIQSLKESMSFKRNQNGSNNGQMNKGGGTGNA